MSTREKEGICMKNIKKIFILLITLLISFQSPLFIITSYSNEIDRRLLSLIAEEERATRSTNNDYTVGFSLETLYRYNQIIHSKFNFKITVLNDKVTIAPDGSYRDLSYVWADDYTVTIYGAKGEKKFSDRVTWFGNVFNDVNSLTQKLSKVNIQIGDSIELGNTWYPPGTITWYGNEDKYYKSTRNDLSYQKNLQKYLITSHGLIKQPANVTISPSNTYAGYLKLNVYNKATAKTEERRIDYKVIKDPNHGEYTLKFSTDNFGTKDNTIWSEDYKIASYTTDGGIESGVVFEAGDNVSDGLEALVRQFQFHTGWTDYRHRLIFSGQSNNSIKLFDDNSTAPVNFTNTNQNFNNGFGKPAMTFYLTLQGLMQR